MKPIRTIVADDARRTAAEDEGLGAGNFLDTAVALSPDSSLPILELERPLRTCDGKLHKTLSLEQLAKYRDLYATWYYTQQGIRAKDPVGVYLSDGIEYLIHYLALTRIGAIGVLTNGNVEGEIAAQHFTRTGCVAVIADGPHAKAIKNYKGPVVLHNAIRLRCEALLPSGALFRHVAGDPIMIAHSSGTTGVPKAVLLEHDKFFYGVRYRLSLPRVGGGERILSSLPHSHNCAIAYLMLALLSGTPVYITSDHGGENVLKRIDLWRPSMVVSFPQTFVEMTDCAMDSFDLSSVALWFNGGDAAHETHIRKLVRYGSRRVGDKTRRGSVFIDGMGSSEMGFSLFRNVHTSETNHYNRCVGFPLEWVDAAVLSDVGETLGPFEIGRLGVKAPSVTSGYWNDSLLTHRSRMRGYFLTGDLAYRDDEGRFFHVDRVPDAIKTKDGIVYTLLSEEVLMSRCEEISDVSIFGRNIESDDREAVALVRLRRDGRTIPNEECLRRYNDVLASAGLKRLGAVQFVTREAVPLGTTGKVLKRSLRQMSAAQ